MKQEIAEKWVAALNSGEYTQGQYRLRTGEKFCCLGVLCDIASKEGLGTWSAKDRDGDFSPIYYFDTTGKAERCSLPSSVVEWAGLRDGCGTFYENDQETSLIDMNDNNGSSFLDIAQTIQNKVESL